MKVPVYNQTGEETGQIELPLEIFDVKMNSDLVHQIAVSQSANRRQVIAKVKDRGEVRGGGKKPWRQKGTGRARAGSIRSPLWRGGGITFGPAKERNFKKRIPKQMRKKALLIVLSQKARDKRIIILNDLKIEKPKTKHIANVIKGLKSAQGSVLLALPKTDKNIAMAARNIPNLETIQAKDLNVLDLLTYKYLVVPKEAIDTIKETFIKSKTEMSDVK